MAEHQIVDLAVEGSNPSSHPQCPVSGHRGHLLQDIVHRPTSSEWLVVACGVERQSTNQLAVVGEDAYVGSSDEDADSAVDVGGPDRNVSKSAQVAKGDVAE